MGKNQAAYKAMQMSQPAPPAKGRNTECIWPDAHMFRRDHRSTVYCQPDLQLCVCGKEYETLNWLRHCPSDLESCIWPRGVILTFHLTLPNWVWYKCKEATMEEAERDTREKHLYMEL